MTTDNKTLADAQPGGRVRLGDALLPCPFCGSPARRIDFGAGSGDNEGGSCIECTGCQSSGPVEFGYKENFISNWNRRTLSAHPSPGGQDALAALVEACEDMRAASEEIDNGEGLAHVVPYALWNEFLRKLDDAEQGFAACQPVGQSQTHWGWLVDGVPFKGSSTCEMSAVPLYAGEPDPPLVVRVPRHEAAPYFECKPEQWEQHTHGMTTAGKNVLANMLAHHCLLARRDELGWIITRYDLIAEGRPWWHVSNNGKLTYDYDPATKARMVAARQPVGEPVGWYTEDHLTDRSATTYDRTVADRWRAKGWPVSPLYAAPPAQAVDLGPMRDVFRRWHANELNSTDAMLALVEALAVIDSQAVGNG